MKPDTQHTEASDVLQAKDFVIACQPIFSRDMDIFAYELLFRQCTGDEFAIISNYDSATNQIIADGFSLASQRLGPKGMVTINVGYDTIMSRHVLALPTERVILEIPGDTPAPGNFLDVIRELRDAGYRFLVDNYTPGRTDMRELLDLADYVKVSVEGLDGKGVALIKKSLSGWGGKTVASRVESWDVYEGCRYLGFDFFQGFFFSYPKDLVGKKITSHKAARLNFLRLLSDEEVRLARIVEAISRDQALSIRLLHFVNSATFSSGDKVDSLERAASLVGLNALKKWAMSAILSDLDATDQGAELSFLTMHGAIFLGRLAEKLKQGGPAAETLYLLGLLNNVDSLMGMKMKEIVDGMPLEATVKRALMREAKEPLTRFLWLLDAIWRDDWSNAQSLLRDIGVSLPTAAKLYMQAGRDAAALMTSLS
jgi:EAL and modified HD-GYP domain-containing signal transduction protein